MRLNNFPVITIVRIWEIYILEAISTNVVWRIQIQLETTQLKNLESRATERAFASVHVAEMQKYVKISIHPNVVVRMNTSRALPRLFGDV